MEQYFSSGHKRCPPKLKWNPPAKKTIFTVRLFHSDSRTLRAMPISSQWTISDDNPSHSADLQTRNHTWQKGIDCCHSAEITQQCTFMCHHHKAHDWLKPFVQEPTGQILTTHKGGLMGVLPRPFPRLNLSPPGDISKWQNLSKWIMTATANCPAAHTWD